MAGLPSAKDYVTIKSWVKNPKEYGVMTGEEGRLGQYVPESYLDDRVDLKGTRLKFLCRTSSLPVLDRVGRETRPSWPKHSRICLVCECDQVEDVEHFLMQCPGYEDRRTKLLFKH